MDTGTPLPGIVSDDTTLYLGYKVHRSELSDPKRFAVISFSGVTQHTFGYPNDEALGGHPLFEFGLEFYEFNVVHESPTLEQLGKQNALVFPEFETSFSRETHWIVSFHDETLEVLAVSAQVLGTVSASNPITAIMSFID